MARTDTDVARRRIGQISLPVLIAIGWCGVVAASGDPPPTADALKRRAGDAGTLFDMHNVVAALPLYEQLALDDPKNIVYAERVAACVLAMLGSLPPGEERNALVARAQAETKRARELGDDSNLLHTLEATFGGDVSGSQVVAGDPMQAAEAAFSRGDLDVAATRYQAIAASDPSSYEAPLFAGDMYFRKGDARLAGEWFQKAIQVDPNRETAYRYWGDALMKAGDREGALDKFIEAVVAEPYAERPWMGLTQWAKAAGASIGTPDVRLPAAPKVKSAADGKSSTTITIDADMLGTSDDRATAQLGYQLARAAWRERDFAKAFPDEKEYRHSLREEVDAISTMLSMLKEKVAPAEFAALVPIDGDGLLSAYVLISRADEGIARDYDGYREQHRDLLRAYIRKYVVHPRPSPAKSTT